MLLFCFLCIGVFCFYCGWFFSVVLLDTRNWLLIMDFCLLNLLFWFGCGYLFADCWVLLGSYGWVCCCCLVWFWLCVLVIVCGLVVVLW